jgi:5'-3' exonuclease
MFMSRLEDALYYLACVRLQNNRKLSHVQFVVSGATVPGEGEVCSDWIG